MGVLCQMEEAQDVVERSSRHPKDRALPKIFKENVRISYNTTDLRKRPEETILFS